VRSALGQAISSVALAAILVGPVLAGGCGDDDCDAEHDCANKTDRLIVGGKIVPICDAPTKNDGAEYSWATSSGTCTCTLDQSISGSFWRNCTFSH
jgi:hypothetical protein